MEKRYLNKINIKLYCFTFCLLFTSVFAQKSNKNKKDDNISRYSLVTFSRPLAKDSIKITTFVEVPFSSLQFVKRELLSVASVPENTIFNKPDEGNQGSINFRYLFLNKRSHMRNMLSPDQGYGVKISLNISSSKIWGDFNYSKLGADVYSNKKLDYLIVGEKPTKRKINSAKELKVKILQHKEFLKMLNKTS